MLATSGGYSLAELENTANRLLEPRPIITADCSNPHEIDDGLFVKALPFAEETYMVEVCVVDTSKLYNDPKILHGVMTKTEAKYHDLGNNEHGYTPMIDTDLIRSREFQAGSLRRALVVRFMIGEKMPPYDVDVTYERVAVAENLDYRDFESYCSRDSEGEKYGRASALILKHLQYTPGGDPDRPQFNLGVDSADDIHQQLTSGPEHKVWKRGSQINESFMVAANHLVGALMTKEGRLAIYRVHDPEDVSLLEIMPSNVATYSLRPGPHHGLGIKPYCRITSPLRRGEDFFMGHLLDLRHKGLPVTIHDEKQARVMVQQLNQRVIADVWRGPLRTAYSDVFGPARQSAARSVSRRYNSHLTAVSSGASEVAIA